MGRKLTLPAEHVPESWGRRVEIIAVEPDARGVRFFKVRSETTGREAMIEPSLVYQFADLKTVKGG